MEATFTDNGNSSTLLWKKGTGSVIADGTFGSGTLKLQCRRTGDTTASWIDVGSNVTFTANSVGNFTLGYCELRLNLAGATTPSITAHISDIKR